MKRTDYILTIIDGNGQKHKESFLTPSLRHSRLKELVDNKQNPMINGEKLVSVERSEEEVDEENFVFDVALIASIISGEHYRSLMIKTLLSHVEVSKLIATVAIDVYREVKSRYPKVLDPAAPQDPLLLQVTDLAKKMIWEKHNLKL